MADEILVLEGNARDVYQMIFFFPITSPRAGYIPTPAPRDEAGALTGWGPLAQSRSAALIAALDSGATVYRSISFRKNVALTNPQLLTRIREIYAATKLDVEAVYVKASQHFGIWINAV